MSNAIMSLPEKRPNCDQIVAMQENRMKNDLPTVDCAMKLQSDIQYFCMICSCNTDHWSKHCPKRSKMMAKGCSICREPCEIKEHEKNSRLLLKSCVRCDDIGTHWSKDCPDPIYDDCDWF